MAQKSGITAPASASPNLDDQRRSLSVHNPGAMVMNVNVDDECDNEIQIDAPMAHASGFTAPTPASAHLDDQQNSLNVHNPAEIKMNVGDDGECDYEHDTGPTTNADSSNQRQWAYSRKMLNHRNTRCGLLYPNATDRWSCSACRRFRSRNACK